MRARFPLSSRILLLAAVNIGLLLVLLLVFVRFELGMRVDQLMFAPAQDRAISVGRAIAVDLEQTPDAERTDLMARYSRSYAVDFYLFLNDGQQVAGRPVTLPAEVSRELVRTPEGGRGGRRAELPDLPPDEAAPPPPPPPRSPPPRSPPPRDGRPDDGKRPPRDGKGREGDVQRAGLFQKSAGGLYWVGVRIPLRSDAGGEGQRATVIMAAKSFYGTPLFFNFFPWFGALAAAIAICAVCWLPFIHGLTKTVTLVTRATQQMAEGHFEHHLPEDRGDELGQLSASINSMAGRLSGFVTGQKRFLGDIAHELCAPLARIEFGMGILEHQTPAESREAVGDVQDDVHHMSGLVAELLSFSKAGMEAKDRPLLPVNLADAAREAISREDGDDRVEMTIAPDIFALADHGYLVRSLANLLRNALRYSGDEGPITISARRDRENVLLLIADSGPGLPEEELDRIFTPFYRPEKARDRESGGTGLGLAIVKSCVEACGGSVVCRNRVPFGLEAEIRLRAA